LRATIKPLEKGFALMLGEHELGVSKTDCDARIHMHAVNDALDVAYLEGQKYLELLVQKRRLEYDLLKAKLKIQAEIHGIKI